MQKNATAISCVLFLLFVCSTCTDLQMDDELDIIWLISKISEVKFRNINLDIKLKL